MSMGASIEGRVPFLDHRCVEFCFQIPLKYRLHWWETKYFLKKYSCKSLPQSIIKREKSGFGSPLAGWFRDSEYLGGYLDLLKGDNFKSSNIFKNDTVGLIIRQHLEGKVDHSEILWELINFQLWKQIFFDRK